MQDGAEFQIRVEKILYLTYNPAFLLTTIMNKQRTINCYKLNKINKTSKNFLRTGIT